MSAELQRRIDVALDALVDVDRAADGDFELDAWLSQSRLALLAAADTVRQAERDRLIDELDAELDELELGDEAAA